MNTRDDHHDDRLLEEYRRASDAQAGQPRESTRKAILEGARAAAVSRRPAANDLRYAWSAVAGVAVLGVALLLWRQADPHLAADGQILSEVGPVDAPARVAESAKSTSGARPASSAVVAQAPAAEARREVAADIADESSSRLRDLFPDAWSSASPPAMVWIVEDAGGNPLRQGTLAVGEPLPTLQPMLSLSARSANVGAAAADAAGSLQSPTTGWSLQTAVNSAGVPVQIATAREPLQAPAAAAEADR